MIKTKGADLLKKVHVLGWQMSEETDDLVATSMQRVCRKANRATSDSSLRSKRWLPNKLPAVNSFSHDVHHRRFAHLICTRQSKQPKGQRHSEACIGAQMGLIAYRDCMVPLKGINAPASKAVLIYGADLE
jgi:hypothetical protein